MVSKLQPARGSDMGDVNVGIRTTAISSFAVTLKRISGIFYRSLGKTDLLPNVSVIGRLKFSHLSYLLRFQPSSGLDFDQKS